MRIELSEKELNICRTLINVAERSTAGKLIAVHNGLEPGAALAFKDAKKLLSFISLYQMVLNDNQSAVQRMTRAATVTDAEFMIRTYREATKQINAEDVSCLHARIREFLKEAEKQHIPARKLYIADCHFYHNRICQELDCRGFAGFEEMNEHMIKQWNEKVHSKDEVYILGDLSIAKSDATEKILNQLNGKLHMIIGNHDKYLEDRHFDRTIFRSVDHYLEIRDNGRNVILSHYPVFCYKGQYRTDKHGKPLTYMLYGHVHDTHDEELVNRFIMQTRLTLVRSRHGDAAKSIPCHMINCFCMFSDYQPMTLDEWIAIDEKRRRERKQG